MTLLSNIQKKHLKMLKSQELKKTGNLQNKMYKTLLNLLQSSKRVRKAQLKKSINYQTLTSSNLIPLQWTRRKIFHKINILNYRQKHPHGKKLQPSVILSNSKNLNQMTQSLKTVKRKKGLDTMQRSNESLLRSTRERKRTQSNLRDGAIQASKPPGTAVHTASKKTRMEKSSVLSDT